jgi:predicted dehydrogenase
MERLRVGLIGCGGAAGWHVGTLLGLGDVRIVALCDPSEANLERMRKAYPMLVDVPSFATTDLMYEQVELDAVEIVTPHTLHGAQVLEAISRGLHVLCEKPLACSPEEARTIAAAANEAGVTVMVSYQRRLDPAYLYMRNAIQAGELGDLQTITVTCAQSWRRGTKGTWRQDPALSGGGMLLDSGSHLVDMLLWLADKPVKSVSALVDNLGETVDMNSVATILFEGGAQGQLTAIGDLPATWIETVLIVGTKGVLRYETEPQHPWRTGRVVHYRDGGIVQPLELPRGATPDEAWIDTILGRGQNPAPPEAGLAVATLTAAIYQAAASGSVVEVENGS